VHDNSSNPNPTLNWIETSELSHSEILSAAKIVGILYANGQVSYEYTANMINRIKREMPFPRGFEMLYNLLLPFGDKNFEYIPEPKTLQEYFMLRLYLNYNNLLNEYELKNIDSDMLGNYRKMLLRIIEASTE